MRLSFCIYAESQRVHKLFTNLRCSDCISIAKGLGYEYDSALGKSNGHWITPTYSGAFTSSSALKAKIKDALQTYQTVGYTYCNFAFESNGEGEYYIYIFVG